MNRLLTLAAAAVTLALLLSENYTMNRHHRPPVNGLQPRSLREVEASPYDWWQAYPAPVPRRDWWLGVLLALALGLAGAALLLWELDALVVQK